MAKCIPALALVATAGRAQVSGQVTDPATGAPIAHATVDIPQQFDRHTTTDAAGHFTIDHIADGRWIVRVRAASGAVRLAGVTVRDGAAPPLAITLATPTPVPISSSQSGTARPSRITMHPDAPEPATVGELTVESDSSAHLACVTGTVAGLPVTLRRAPTGAFVGLYAVPLEVTHPTVPVALTYRYADATEAHRDTTLAVTLPPAPPPSAPAAKREALRVAPVFTAPPTDTTKRRVAAEGELAHLVGTASLGTAPKWTEPFIRPRPGRITSPFGRGRMFNGTMTSQHTGTDFAGAIGDPVVAANRGVVVLVADFFLAGTVVYVDHGGGLLSAYFHLSNVHVAMGDTVGRGQLIGDVGKTGRVTGPHLHWVVRYGATSVDAMSALALAPIPATPLPESCGR
jgi:murein DD-endopeptidase MepM/ murein hydrolase activator NlpD